MDKKMTGLLISVYRNPLGDSTLGGVSAKHDTLLLIGEGVDGPFAPSADYPCVTIVRRGVRGHEYTYLVPCDEDANPLPGWWMAGGNFGFTDDGRFPSWYPLSIHDRQEPAYNDW